MKKLHGKIVWVTNEGVANGAIVGGALRPRKACATAHDVVGQAPITVGGTCTGTASFAISGRFIRQSKD
jgi:hypothetical protein